MSTDDIQSLPLTVDFLAPGFLAYNQLATDDLAALGTLPYTRRSMEAGSYILREGDRSAICPILVSGFAFRHKSTTRGGRQIVAVKLPGDLLDLQSLYVARVDHNLQALTRVELAFLRKQDIERVVAECPNIARAVVLDIIVEASIGREWLLNIGRRDGLERLAHFLCELHCRLSISGKGLIASKLPLTQEQIADLLGLSPVHVNRCLKALEHRGAVVRQGRDIRIGDLRELRHIAEFTDLYLHLDG